ncbi:MAG TPA: hypothetical protein PK992_06060, partial [Planctomycetaceae bacterium]|nr:hypothetical protein [Planctomycetaceae bacterium]
QRFRTKGKKEIEEMLVGALPDLTETQSGRDLIQIGVEKGKAQGKAEGKAEGKVEGVVEGKRESLLLILGIRFGAIPAKASKAISAIESASRLDELTRQALLVTAIDELQV